MSFNDSVKKMKSNDISKKANFNDYQAIRNKLSEANELVVQAYEMTEKLDDPFATEICENITDIMAKVDFADESLTIRQYLG